MDKTDKSQLRRISTAELTMINQGGYGKIYMLPPDKVLKVFYGFTPDEMITDGFHSSRLAFEHGVPCIQPFEMVQTEEGLGVIYEYLSAPSLAEQIHSGDGKLEDYARIMAQTGKLLAQTHFGENTIRCANAFYSHGLDRFRGLLPDSDIEHYNRAVALVPYRDTAVHGDFHARNILLREGRAVLIDMDDFSCGHPVWDLATAVMYSDKFPHLTDGMGDKTAFSGISSEEAKQVWQIFIGDYFDGLSGETLETRTDVIAMYGVIHFIRIILDRIPEGDGSNPAVAYCTQLIHTFLAGFTEEALQKAEQVFREW